MKFVALSGSLRRGSVHTGLLRYVQRIAAPKHTLTLLDYRDLPHFDADLLAAGEPQALTVLRAAIAEAEGVIIASPEYNHGVPGPLKNALDWLSRPAFASVFAGKAVAVLSASPSPVGGARGLEQLKLVLSGMASALMPYPDVVLGGSACKLSDRGVPIEETTVERLTHFLAAFERWSETVTTRP